MAPRPRTSLFLATLATVVVAGTLVAAPSPAARPDQPGPRGARTPGHAAVPGGGDRDHDRVADDLEAALDTAAPGQRLRVVVQGTTSTAGARAVAPSLRVEHRFRLIDGFSGSLLRGQVAALARAAGVTRIELDGAVHALDESGNRDYGVTAARATGAAPDLALDGTGVGICFVDTGVDPAHESLSARVVGFKDFVNGRTTPYDDQGHGTHVAGIAAGKPAAAGAAYGGVAPDATIYSAKVLDSTGYGDDAVVVLGIQWCAAQPGVKVISMSLGSPPSDGSDVASVAANAAVAAGKVVVVAAGNDGDGPGTIDAPGTATDVITVGAASDPSSLAGANDTDTGLYLAGFSSRGPTTNPAAPTKPDVVAPGLSVMSAQAGTTSGYVALSGTSMATPFVAGVVALGLEAAPGTAPLTVKQALRTSARDAGAAGPDNEWGWGLVDARSFLAALGAAGAGTAPWPARTSLNGTVGSGATTDYPFTVGTAGQPLGVTLRTTNGASTCVLPVGGACWYGYEWAPDLDAYLVNPSGTVVASSRCMLQATNNNCGAPGRFETLGIPSAAAGTWRLRVESSSGAGSFAADVFGALGTVTPTAPSPPTGLTATALSSSSIRVSWTDTSSDETGFTVQRCLSTSCTYADAATLPAGTTSFTDTGLAASTAYDYRVLATNGAGSSAWSGTATATTLAPTTVPAAPTNLTATVSGSQVTLRWVDNASNETGFQVLRCTGTKCTPTTIVATLGANIVTWTNTGLAARTSYRYQVAAYNGNGSAPSPVVTAKTR